MFEKVENVTDFKHFQKAAKKFVETWTAEGYDLGAAKTALDAVKPPAETKNEEAETPATPAVPDIGDLMKGQFAEMFMNFMQQTMKK